MEKRILLYILMFSVLALTAVSCNDDEEEEQETSVATYTQSSTAITGFNLIDNSDILANLDSVFFTIDLQQARIYNADSLPKGTDISRMLVKLSYPSCHSVEVSISNAERMRDTTFAYSDEDTIDFTGEVRIKVTALDYVTNRTYDVKVNVHKMESDSLQWGDVAYSTLPSMHGKVAKQKAVEKGGDVYCLMNDDGYYVLATADSPTSVWTKQEVTFPFTPDVRSFAAAGDAFYILSADDGELYTSADAINWTACGVTWSTIIGGYADRVLGVTGGNGAYSHDEYPRRAGFAPAAVDDEFPVAGMSNIAIYENSWGSSPIAFCMGGVTATSELVDRAWAYDGNGWSVLGNNGIGGHEGMSMLLYTTYAVNEDNWDVTAYPTLMAWGGRTEDGELSNTMYVSRDMGVHWSIADSLLQLPAYMPKVYRADALVFNTTMTDAAAAAVNGALKWRSMPSPEMPVWFNMAVPAALPQAVLATRSSGISPVTEWEVPYIYLFGGEDLGGNTHDTVWRGLLNRLSYKPVY